jgi:hypothetical protein
LRKALPKDRATGCATGVRFAEEIDASAIRRARSAGISTIAPKRAANRFAANGPGW